jgi:acyl carrier protein
MQAAFNSSIPARIALAIERATQIDPAEISPSTRLVNDLGLGRIGRLRVAICLEEAFDHELSDDDVDRFITVADIVSYFGHRYSKDYDYSMPAAFREGSAAAVSAQAG